ncbi:High-affinity branched-chain amino acid transport system permease protein LivM (LIV-I protein M) [Pseudovibrio sp. FO-BEG1]|uniref:high-affinity branched-chain amino acid ABC transporter permease LivM n=1 Tax=unclassified Pseudovibrio TaxID=2627060 RepID=UPI000186B58D|nr:MULTISPECIES: high-affinity branched-chain amino acid ABC transporter permease LivM [unclassified Pseudovibrio]AEV38529.1 High-affinity branched-chain amino acid transport system permease protein LivM (LIV-I protein M) [Pseudovibrio sp. FO-BEG1]EEA95507.1 inner-membrane translocator [Pseudovibrio sp. JE062]
MQARQRDSLLVASLKDSLGGAVITFALACVMVGLKVDVASGRGAELFLEHRWLAVATAVIVVFAGRFLLNMFFWKREDAPSIGISGFLPKGGLGTGSANMLKYGMLVLAVVLPFALMFWLGSRGSRQYIDLAILVLTYVMLGWGLNIVVGLAGLLDLGYVAFYAVGAYSYALLAHYFGFSFWICLPLAGILAAFWGIILGFPVLRLRGDYLAIVTLAFGEIIRVVLLNWYEFTGGPDGLSGIPRPSFFGLEFTRGEGGFADFFGLKYNSIHRIIFLYYLIFIMAMLTNFVTMRLRRMPIGRAWEALREDEIACRALGINTTNTKLTAFALGAMFGGFAGSFFATRQGFISPESFTFLESAIILAIVVLGGLGSQMGVVIAAVVMIGGFEFFREFEEYRMLVFGLIMVVIMVWKPRGLVSSRTPSVALSKNAKGISADLVQEGHG